MKDETRLNPWRPQPLSTSLATFSMGDVHDYTIVRHGVSCHAYLGYHKYPIENVLLFMSTTLGLHRISQKKQI